MSDTQNRGGDAQNRAYRKKPYWNVYKPLKKDDAGAAIQFSYDSTKRAVFLEAANQRGPKLAIGAKDQFDWDGKIVFKIGVADVAKLLPLFNGRKSQSKCLHSQPEKQITSVLEINAGEYNGEPNFGFKLSRTAEGKTQRVQMFLNAEELGILAHFIRESLTRMLGFGAEE
tara:strand:- start:116 stop:628 length:513 start_codon:yes stop_codon:yes gene_type:complete